MFKIYKIARIIACVTLVSFVGLCVSPLGSSQPQYVIEEDTTETTQVMMIEQDEEKEDLELIVEEDDEEDVEIFIPNYIDMIVPSSKTFKAYMDANCITNTTSDQYKLKLNYQLDYSTGIYTVNGRYVCALGSYYTTEIGTIFDVVMKSGEIIPCILGDCKDDRHTDGLNQYTVTNGSVLEFIVNTKILTEFIGKTGDVSTLGDKWNEEILYIRIYRGETDGINN